MSLLDSIRRILSGADSESTPRAEQARAIKSEAELCLEAETILKAAIDAVDPEKLVVRALSDREGSLGLTGNIWIVGFGKAAAPMARGARTVLRNRVSGGVIIVPVGEESQAPPGIDAFGAGHPIPDPAGVAGASAIRQVAREARETDLVLCLVSGGGSSMLTLPPDGMPVEEVQVVTEQLLRAGATIGDLNCVRKHLDQLKGGRLAREAAPARVLGLILSDVVGDALDVIASGPISPDTTRFADAVDVLRRYDVWKTAPLAVRGYLDHGVKGDIEDSPRKSEPCFGKVDPLIVGNSTIAARAACAEAERLGYRTQLLTSTLTGEAREAGKFLAETVQVLRRTGRDDREPFCLVAAGETVVSVQGNGRGGRNQELALGAAETIDGMKSVLVASMGTDGVDGPTDAAGAFVTGSTLRRARDAGLDWQDALARNDSYPFFRALDDLIVSGPTGTNVADVQVALIDVDSDVSS